MLNIHSIERVPNDHVRSYMKPNKLKTIKEQTTEQLRREVHGDIRPNNHAPSGEQSGQRSGHSAGTINLYRGLTGGYRGKHAYSKWSTLSIAKRQNRGCIRRGLKFCAAVALTAFVFTLVL